MFPQPLGQNPFFPSGLQTQSSILISERTLWNRVDSREAQSFPEGLLPPFYQSCREKWPQQNEMPRMELQNPMESPAFHSFHKYLLNVYCVLGPMVCSPCPDTLLGSVPEGLTLGPMQTPQRGQRDANPKKTEVPPRPCARAPGGYLSECPCPHNNI